MTKISKDSSMSIFANYVKFAYQYLNPRNFSSFFFFFRKKEEAVF